VTNPSGQSVSIIDTHSLTVKDTIVGIVGASSFGKFIGPQATPPASTPIVEFYHPALDHYFITSDAGEIEALDSKTLRGWGRTGQVFFAPTASASAQPVCRYYGLPAAGLASHFYSASVQECNALAQNYPTSWVKETDTAFFIDLPDVATGTCRAGSIPVWRLWNDRADSNHRYTTNANVRAAMLAQGYVAEGYGPLAVAMCAVAP
jgi:hypothetical protein